MGNWVVPAATLLGVGWYFATCIILGVLVGQWADSRVGVEPLFTLLGILLGIVLSFWGGYRMIRPLLEKYGNGPTTGKG